MAASQIYSGSVTHSGAGQTVLVTAVGVPAKTEIIAVTVSSSYPATAGTTGVKLQVGASIDDGATFSDYADVVTTAPTASQGSAQSAEAFASLDTYKAATHLRFKLINLDGTNDATVVLLFRASYL